MKRPYPLPNVGDVWFQLSDNNVYRCQIVSIENVPGSSDLKIGMNADRHGRQPFYVYTGLSWNYYTRNFFLTEKDAFKALIAQHKSNIRRREKVMKKYNVKIEHEKLMLGMAENVLAGL
jgi:hypothetical protein